MRQSVVRSVTWNLQTAGYKISEQTEQGSVSLPMHDESNAWHDWLEEVPSFMFQSRNGHHFTAVKQRRGSVYWIAYRRAGGRLKKKYLGPPGRITLARLEQVATSLAASAPPVSAPAPSSSASTAQSTSWPQGNDWLDEQLLSTKFFVPSSSHVLISRPHLMRLLDEGRGRPLTLVSAPAGFGKTTLLSAWVHAHQADHPHVAWVSLDEGDNDLVHFWIYVLTALDHVQSGLCTDLVSHLHTQPSPPMQSVLTALINRLVEQTEQALLVLDDYHLITEQAIHRSLMYLLNHLPSQLRVVLSSRSDPPLPLARLRSRGQVLEVRTDQLRATLEEARAFLHEVMELSLADQELARVEDRTEGWLAGLQLVGLSLQERTDQGSVLEELHGSQRYILEYLLEEVLRRLPPSVQTFLLQTSVLERLTASLCDAVTQQPGSQQVLEFLERANVFVVPLDRERRWYRYHVLFAEALRYRLEQTEGEALSALHRRASQWYAEQGNLHEAVRHAVNARDWQRVADLIEPVHALFWSSSEHAMLRRWLEQLPVEVVRSRPRLCLAYARTLYQVASYTTMEGWLHDAEVALRATLPAPTNGNADTETLPPSQRQERDNLLGEIAAYRAAITAFDLGEGQAALTFCQEALAHLSEENLVARAEVAYAQSLASHALGDIVPAIHSAREATALAQAAGNLSAIIVYQCRTAYSLLLHGKLHEVVQMAQHAALLGTTAAGLPHAMVCWAYIVHADVLREWNRLDEALELALQGARLSEQTETIVALYLAYTVLMRVYLARGELEAARLAFYQAEATLAKTYSPYRRDIFLIVEWVQFWLVSGEVERAIRWTEERAQQDSGPSPLARERQEVARARILLAQKKPTEALSLLESLQVSAQKQQRLSHVIEMKVLQALAYQMRRQEQEALTVLAQVLRLAEPEGYMRIFVDEGAPMATLLSRLKGQEREHGPTPYLDTVLAAFQDNTAHERQPARAGQHMAALPQLDPLSEREREVLRLIVRGASNQEIAETLVLSIDTIKRHVSNIFSKLGVNNRVQAAARARVLGLLSDEP